MKLKEGIGVLLLRFLLLSSFPKTRSLDLCTSNEQCNRLCSQCVCGEDFFGTYWCQNCDWTNPPQCAWLTSTTTVATTTTEQVEKVNFRLFKMDCHLWMLYVGYVIAILGFLYCAVVFFFFMPTLPGYRYLERRRQQRIPPQSKVKFSESAAEQRLKGTSRTSASAANSNTNQAQSGQPQDFEYELSVTTNGKRKSSVKSVARKKGSGRAGSKKKSVGRGVGRTASNTSSRGSRRLSKKLSKN